MLYRSLFRDTALQRMIQKKIVHVAVKHFWPIKNVFKGKSSFSKNVY